MRCEKYSAETEVIIPKFKVEGEHVLSDLFNFVDFSSFPLTGLGLKASPITVVQKAAYGIDENKSYGAAATQAAVGRSASIPEKFEFNRPFLFIETDMNLNPKFVGRIEDF